ncbi:tetratricopeptide repeat protein [Chloroflexota bacterium]
MNYRHLSVYVAGINGYQENRKDPLDVLNAKRLIGTDPSGRGLKNMDERMQQEISDMDERMQRKFSDQDKLTQKKTPKQLRKVIDLASRGKRRDAITEITNYIKKKPNDPMAYILRGDLYDDMGQKEVAIDDYSEAIRLQPELSGAYDKRATAYAELGRLSEAIQEHKKAIEIKPKALYYYNMAVAYDSLNDNRNAIYSNTKALELDNGHTQAYYMRGISYSQIGDYQKAIADYNKALALVPEFIRDVYFRRAEAYQEVGKKTLALADFRKAMEHTYDQENLEIIEDKIQELTK